MAYVPNSGSVVAFQGTVPFSVLGTTVGSVISVQQGSVATVIIGGSIAASFTPPANQSVSGTIHVDNFSSVIAYQLAGSILATSATVNPAANQSVSGTVGASIIGLPPVNVTNTVTVVSSLAGGIFPVSGSVSAVVTNFPTTQNVSGSVVSFQGGAPWAQTNVGSIITVAQSSVAVAIVSGSIAVSVNPPANQSVSGTVQTDVRGSVATVIIGGSIAASFTPPANQSVSGTVTVNQGTTPWVQTGSVQGTVSVLGTVPVTQSGGWNVSVVSTVPSSVMVGASIFGQLPAGTAMLGSIVTYQGALPWAIAGSVAAFQAGANITSLVSTVPSSVLVGASIMGSVPVTLIANTIPAAASILVGVTANTNGSVITTTGYPETIVQITSGPGASITAAINFEGTVDGTQFVPIQGYNVTNNTISSITTAESNWVFNTAGLQGMRTRVSNWSVGSITARAVLSPTDARPFSQIIVGNPSISGTVQVGNTNVNVSGSVVAFQGAGWSGSVAATITNTNVNVSGSVTATQVGTWKTSIASNYAAGAASVISAIGNLAFGVRNDTLASVLATSDGQYIPWTVGPAGENITANAPLNKWVQGTTSVLNQFGTSMATIAAQGTSIFTYITSGQVANMSGSSVLVTFSGATSSVIGYTIAPPGGGSNIVIPNAWKSNANGAVTASVSGAASVYISLQGFISKT